MANTSAPGSDGFRQLKRQVTRALPRNVLVMLAVLMAGSASNAQFLDMLKDQATKALQKKVEDKPTEPPTKADGKTTPGNVASSGTQTPPQSLQAYQGYDFVPGDTIVFEDSFEKDEDGEFPSHWNQGDGQGAVNMFAGRKAFTVTAGSLTQVSPAIKSPKYLSDSWTLEFDTYAIDGPACLAVDTTGEG